MRLPFHFSLWCIGEGNGNPLQCSCLENPRDGGAWWAAVYGVTQSRTQLKWLSSSRSLLNISCIFSILVTRLCICNSIVFSRFWIIFTIIILNPFSGRLPISFSFVWFGGLLSCPFTCWIFLCISNLFRLLCFGLVFLYAGSLWFLFIVEVPPCGWGWMSGLSGFPG